MWTPFNVIPKTCMRWKSAMRGVDIQLTYCLLRVKPARYESPVDTISTSSAAAAFAERR
jgi:hypothetical protein